MMKKYEEKEIRIFLKYVRNRRISILILFGVYFSLIILALIVGFDLDSIKSIIPIFIILMLPVFYFSFHVDRFMCPRCGECYVKNKRFFYRRSIHECAHCGLSIFGLAELRGKKPKSSTKEWLE